MSEADLNSHGSMTYTPSPPRFRVVLPEITQVLDGHLSARRREKVHFAPFAAVLGAYDGEQSQQPLRDASSPTTLVDDKRNKPISSIAQNEGKWKDDDKVNSNGDAPDTPVESQQGLDISASFSVDSFTIGQNKKRSSTISDPFGCILGAIDKENSIERPSIASIDNDASEIDFAQTCKATTNYYRPIRKVDKAGLRKNVKKAPGVDNQLANKQESKGIRELIEMKRREGIQLKQQYSHRLTQKRVKGERERRQEILERIDEEVKFKSIVHQDHQRKLREQAEEDRRKSIAVREKIRKNRRQGQEKLHMERIEEDAALYEERHEASIALKEFKLDLSKNRRESLAIRSDQAAFSRKKVEKTAQEDRNRQHESFHLKFEAAKDVEAYLASEEEKRRKSIAGRNEFARQQRQRQADEQAQQAKKEHELFELELEADRDVVEYKHSMKMRDRTSLAHRGLEARRRRLKEEQLRAFALENEHESFELKWAGKRDADAYCEKLKRLQREDLALQNSEHRRKARVMDELRQIEREKEAESYVLKRAGEKDADRYLEKLAEDRRKSLQLRGVQTVQGRKVEQLQRAEELQKQHEDEELHAADHKDMEEYRKSCKERDRLSLEYRLKDARRKRTQDKNESEQQLEQEHKSFELKREDRKDVEKYLKECKQRRRMSLAYRAKEKKRHARWKEQQKQQEIVQRRRQVHANIMDKHYEELARYEEILRMTQEAMRHI